MTVFEWKELVEAVRSSSIKGDTMSLEQGAVLARRLKRCLLKAAFYSS